jgi:biopolymer transport protein ExbD
MGIKKRNKVSADFNMSSLTDIIFLLLIFFMLTSAVVSPNALDLQLPGNKTSPPPPKAKNRVIGVAEDGSYSLNNAPINISGIEKEIDKLRIIDGDKAAIVVSPAGIVNMEKVVAVLDLAYRKKIRAVLTEPR